MSTSTSLLRELQQEEAVILATHILNGTTPKSSLTEKIVSTTVALFSVVTFTSLAILAYTHIEQYII